MDYNIASTSAQDFNTSTGVLDFSALCCDEELIGFDKNTGSSWIYPTNYPVRDYQYNIVKSALFKNTLVSLPTGLGKTFIAAVIMYNYYRWYPMGKIIFVAPTKPLVAQQIEACYKIMAIPPKDTIEMTGNTQIAARKLAWQQKRVFFATPQVIQNDLESGTCPGELVRCIVIDEAHRARGRHAYCQLIDILMLRGHNLFRVLALSATPGSKVDDVIKVIQNLKIAHLELRTEECLDVSMYSHQRKIETVVIQLGDELSAIREQFINILDIYTRRLVQFKVLTGNIGSLSKGRIIMLYKEYQNREKSLRHPQHNHIMLDFTMVITLYHALELLTKHGARVFLNFFDEHTDKTWVRKDDHLTSFLERLRDDLGTNPMSIDRSTLPDGSIPMIEGDLKYGHPKFDHLKKVILEHFNKAKKEGKETKAIVFCEYRESVSLVHCLLLQCRPLIKPHMFIGQGFGGAGSSKDPNFKPFSQKQQLKVMQSFREGTCNVLVSTCVGEEGLDVGSVDLIICFDISNKSPVRLVQRCGRTGRERGGRVIILVTEGKEHQTLRECIYQKDNLNKRVLQSGEIKKSLYSASPRMLPLNVVPECYKMFITVEKKDTAKTNLDKKVQSKIKNILKRKLSDVNADIQQSFLSKDEFQSLYGNQFPEGISLTDSFEMWNATKAQILNENDESLNTKEVSLSRWLEWQRNVQYTGKIGHSKDTDILCHLLQYADSKRFDLSIPQMDTGLSTQDIMIENHSKAVMPKISQPKKKSKPGIKQAPKGKNVDIRDLFTKINRLNNKEESLFDDKLNEILNECGIKKTCSDTLNNYLKTEDISPALLDLMVELEIEDSKPVKSPDYGYFSPYMIEAAEQDFSAKLKNFIIPDMSCVDNITLEMLRDYNSKAGVNKKNIFDSQTKLNNTLSESQLCNIFDTQNDDPGSIDSSRNKVTVDNIVPKNLDIIDIDSIFKDSDDSLSPKGQNSSVINKNNPNNETKNPLNFFGLGSIDEIFGDDSFDAEKDDDRSSPIIPTQKSKKLYSSSQSCSYSQSQSQSSMATVLKKINLGQTIKSNDSSQIGNDNSNDPQTSGNHSILNIKKKDLVDKEEDPTSLSVTQIINIINKDEANINEKGILNEPKGKIENLTQIETSDVTGEISTTPLNFEHLYIDLFKSDDSEESTHSVILSSQKPSNDVNLVKNKTPTLKTKVVIPASSESSDESICIEENYSNIFDDSEISPVSESKLDMNIGRIDIKSDLECSPFFGNSPSCITASATPKGKLSLKDKLRFSSCSLERKCTEPEQNLEKSSDKNKSFEIQDQNDLPSCSQSIISHVSQFAARKYQSQKLKVQTSISKTELSLNKSENSDDSDNDFIEKPTRKNQNTSSDKDSSPQKRKTKVKKNKKRPACEFIDYEAILSDDSYEKSSGDDDYEEGSNVSLNSFICDEHTEADESIDMNAKYMQSVKSPIKTFGGFKIPKLPTKHVDVFSQPYPEQDTSYELDSFCVDVDQGLTQRNDMSELEIAEIVLKKRKRRRNKIIDDTVIEIDENKSESDDSPVALKKKRVHNRIDSESSSNSDDDFI